MELKAIKTLFSDPVTTENINPNKNNGGLIATYVGYESHYSETSLWKKVKNVITKAGRKVVTSALTLYYILIDDDTPLWARTIVTGALGYFILPVDAIPDFMPVVGYTDDLAVFAAALCAVAAHEKEEHRLKAEKLYARWAA